jgi:hypothetical protein
MEFSGVTQRLLLRLQQMPHPVLHNERRVKACCIPGIFLPFSLLAAYQPSPAASPPWPLRPFSSPRALPRSTRRRAPASLHPPPHPLLPSSSSYPGLAPSSAAPPSPSASALAQIRWCGLKDRGPGQRRKDRQCGRRGASSPAACLLSSSFTLAPCVGGPSSRAQRRRWRPSSGARRPAPPPSPVTGGADLWQRGLRGVGRDSASGSRSPPSRPPPQLPAPASALLILGAAGGNSRVSARRLARRLLELLLFCST